jgi:hypothetical protein
VVANEDSGCDQKDDSVLEEVTPGRTLAMKGTLGDSSPCENTREKMLEADPNTEGV